ncbi:MAG: hypothetical protein GY706_02200 [Bacteroides sp.]|nr:hypothetical protein [Bacteroides sp.]
MRVLFIVAALALLSACSVQQTYYDAELAVASDDERKGNYKAAHENLVSAVWRAKNHLGPKEVSTAYYNLGTFFRRQANFENSISTLQESIKYAKDAGTFDDLAFGRRHIEIATSYAALDQWESGIPHIKEVIPYWERYSGSEYQFVTTVFAEYSKALTNKGVSAKFIPNKASNPTP